MTQHSSNWSHWSREPVRAGGPPAENVAGVRSRMKEPEPEHRGSHVDVRAAPTPVIHLKVAQRADASGCFIT
ncbi:hypothetical protein AAFF_G00131940 [Aldrovandia affinis]|uniref:Uncharacterized protein n=1 Tax=Aldrovandia affinis TaxID=143900 RepID=A0AAD7RQQ1_9TELE|nr:hypothetical protein AAFF_G00131940 [Aldrovandia affinis]